MKLQTRLVLSMSAIGLVVFVGLIIIFNSASGVRFTAGKQNQQVHVQTQSVEQLKLATGAVLPALAVMKEMSQLKQELSQVQYAFANASLTLANTDLAKANQSIELLEPKVMQLLVLYPEFSKEKVRLEEAFKASKIYGNKMNELLLKNLSNIAGNMASGLDQQMNIIATILDQINLKSIEDVNRSVSKVVDDTEALKASADLVQGGVTVIEGESATVNKTVVFVGIFVLLFTAGVALALSNTLNRAVFQLNQALMEIGRSKRLSIRIDRQQNDELGIIARAVDMMMEVFEGVVHQVANTATTVGREIDMVSQRSGQLSNLISQQKASMESIAAAVTEMSASAKEVSRIANTTSEISQSANTLGRRGSEVVGASIDNIKLLSGQLNASEKTFDQLAEDVASIGNILAVIEGIAEQTNLLALNAAIEAARAGEQGRGFAVVADEVRSLARRTQEGTIEIRRNIENLQNRTGEVLQVMQRSISHSSESVTQAQQVDSVIENIVKTLSDIVNQTHIIATAAKEQHSTNSEISERVSALLHSSMEIAELAQDSKSGGDRMSKQGEALTSAISIFTFEN